MTIPTMSTLRKLVEPFLGKTSDRAAANPAQPPAAEQKPGNPSMDDSSPRPTTPMPRS